MNVTMAISAKEKELSAVGVSVATGCKPCTDYHVKAVRKAGAADDEIGRAVADALAVRRVATAIMERYALAHLGKVGPETGSKPTEQTNRIKALVSIGAAFGVNCASSLEQHLAEAEAVGISQDEIATIAKLAAFIKGRAASHVERLVNMAAEAAA
ncbi:MAG: carboxymuconolactone decarboxylase family protein [Gammaproteobacteria bacterium]